MIWSWPGKIPVSKCFEAPASSLDLPATFLAAADAKLLPLSVPAPNEDKNNVQPCNQTYGEYEGIKRRPALAGSAPTGDRTLFRRLQGQRAVLHG